MKLAVRTHRLLGYCFLLLLHLLPIVVAPAAYCSSTCCLLLLHLLLKPTPPKNYSNHHYLCSCYFRRIQIHGCNGRDLIFRHTCPAPSVCMSQPSRVHLSSVALCLCFVPDSGGVILLDTDVTSPI